MQQITHNECIYAPGDGELVKTLFTTLGFSVTKVDPHPYIIAHVQPDVKDVLNNCFYASELTPTQQAFEKTLREQLASSTEFRTAAEEWENDFRNDPQRSVHFGYRYDTREDFEGAIERVREISAPGQPLEGRVAVTGVYFPGDPGSLSDTLAQGFLWTNLFASGILTFGQHIEMQWHITPMMND